MPTGSPELVRKLLTRGSHRCLSVDETLRRVEGLAERAGVTRVANITGLDTIGLPVVSVMRPNARSRVVSFGRGLDLAAAYAAGLTEAIATHHAEHVTLPLRLSSLRELRSLGSAVDLVHSTDRQEALAADEPTLWIEGVDLGQGERTWLPFAWLSASHVSARAELAAAYVPGGRSELTVVAAGNHLLEAISQGLCGLVEQDALNRLRGSGYLAADFGRIDPASVDDPDCRELLEMFDAADLACGLWDMTSEIGLATCACVIVDRRGDLFRPRCCSFGSGCHPSREIALLRALSGAAQNRLAVVSGARDDADPAFFEFARDPDQARAVRALLEQAPARETRFGELPTQNLATLDADVTHELACLRRAGFGQALAVDLTQAELGLPVVQVVVPGLGAAPREAARALELEADTHDPRGWAAEYAAEGAPP